MRTRTCAWLLAGLLLLPLKLHLSLLQFGLDPDAVRGRFGYYFDRFAVVEEHA